MASSSRAEPSVHVDRRGRIRRWSTSCRQSDERSLSSPLLNPRGQQPNAWAEHHHHRRHPAAERALQVLRNRGSPFHCSPLPLHSRSLVPPRPTSSRGIRVAINLPWRARCQNAERRGLPAGPRAGGGGGGGTVPIGWEGKRASFRNCNSFARQELKLRGGREKERGREGKCLSPLRERKELEGLFRRKITVPWAFVEFRWIFRPSVQGESWGSLLVCSVGLIFGNRFCLFALIFIIHLVYSIILSLLELVKLDL